MKFSAKFGLGSSDEGYDAQFDLNGDGGIGFTDFLIFAENFGKEVPTDDRGVLVAFYEATGGPNWTNRENWLSEAPLDDWQGVTTDENGRVTHLHLYENNLQGAIPQEMARLSRLKWLNLGKNLLTGRISTELGRLSNLEQLHLGDNALTGTVPTELGRLTNLLHLTLGPNRLTGPIPLPARLRYPFPIFPLRIPPRFLRLRGSS